MIEWQNRPLERVYPVVFIDAIHVKTGEGQVANRAIYVAVGVNVDGERDILGLWAGDGSEGAKYWHHVLTEIGNRGNTDVCIVVCDGLTGLPDAVSAVWPKAIVRGPLCRCAGYADAGLRALVVGDRERPQTTNAIESINARIWKAVKSRGHFPTETAALKCVYLAVMSLDPTGRGRQRWMNRWKPALNAFTIAFPGRIIPTNK